MSAPSRAATDSFPDVLALIPDATKLGEIAREHKTEYQGNAPFPHLCIDDFLPEPVAAAMLEAFPPPHERHWRKTDIPQEKKLSASHEDAIPPAIRNVLYALNSARFLTFLEELTGIDGLLPDPYFNGGGMHQIVRGGKLGVHLDFNKYPKLRIDRCLNVLVYLNKDWKDEYGGHLELWDAENSRCVKKILPVFNRCVIFTTSGKSYHGHPTPLSCPEGWSRKSVALYYYVAGKERELARGTEWLETPALPDGRPPLRQRIKALVRDLTPPLAYRWMRKALFNLGLHDG